MSKYPANMAVLAPEFVTAEEGALGNQRRYVFLDAYAVFKVERHGRGFRFEEVRQLNDSAARGLDLLRSLANEISKDAALAGHRLDRSLAALIRVPLDDAYEATAKPALQRIQAALANDVQDASWYDLSPRGSVEQLAADFDLPADWHRPTRQANPCMLERELSARAQSVWLAVAHACLSPDELRRALADYDQWRTANSIA